MLPQREQIIEKVIEVILVAHGKHTLKLLTWLLEHKVFVSAKRKENLISRIFLGLRNYRVLWHAETSCPL